MFQQRLVQQRLPPGRPSPGRPAPGHPSPGQHRGAGSDQTMPASPARAPPGTGAVAVPHGAARTIFFAFGYGGGLLQVTPPRRCWH
jgi:hypothetical protein